MLSKEDKKLLKSRIKQDKRKMKFIDKYYNMRDGQNQRRHNELAGSIEQDEMILFHDSWLWDVED